MFACGEAAAAPAPPPRTVTVEGVLLLPQPRDAEWLRSPEFRRALAASEQGRRLGQKDPAAWIAARLGVEPRPGPAAPVNGVRVRVSGCHAADGLALLSAAAALYEKRIRSPERAVETRAMLEESRRRYSALRVRGGSSRADLEAARQLIERYQAELTGPVWLRPPSRRTP